MRQPVTDDRNLIATRPKLDTHDDFISMFNRRHGETFTTRDGCWLARIVTRETRVSQGSVRIDIVSGSGRTSDVALSLRDRKAEIVEDVSGRHAWFVTERQGDFAALSCYVHQHALEKFRDDFAGIEDRHGALLAITDGCVRINANDAVDAG